MRPTRSSPVLVTGGAGFIGSNLVDRLAELGHPVRIYDSLYRTGVETNLSWLRGRHGSRIEVVIADLRDRAELSRAAEGVTAIFHFAAQTAVTTSLADPDEDFEVNLRGTVNLLEAARRQGSPPAVIFASTNKVYGDLANLRLMRERNAYLPEDPVARASGIGEDRPLAFYTPYGCSKGAADQYVLDYARSFAVPACVFRMSCIYGPRQLGTEDQGWLAHFLYRVRAGRPISIFGDGRQVRDVLFVDDAVEAYLRAWERIALVSGQAFNLGGGPANAVTLRQVLERIEELTGCTPTVQFEDWRPGDQRYFVADTTKIRSTLGLDHFVPWRDGLARLNKWIASERPVLETAIP